LREGIVGRVWKFGNNVNTDEIIPGRYDVTTDSGLLAKYCLCEVRPDFPLHVKTGDLIIAGENFGAGSSREHAPVAIKASGINAVVACSFARIFYRNAVNIGLPVLLCKEIVDQVKDGDDLELDFKKFCIKELRTNKVFSFEPLPPFILRIFNAGGIIPFLKIWDIEELGRS
jgi:3-isopropylmalate/(R)-2-methylmalate dehydratase small subunit